MRWNLLFILTIFIYSCGKTDTGQNRINAQIKEMPILVKPDSIITKVSEIALDIDYIPLQSPAEIPIKALDKVVTCNNKIYVNIITNILCFDADGRFHYKLFRDENDEHIVGIYDFDVDLADTSLFVLAANTILYYKNTGSEFEYKRTIELGEISASKLTLVPGDNKILLSRHRTKGYESALHYLINIQGDILSCKSNYFNRFNPVKNYLREELIHYKFDNKIFCRERFNDTLFSVDKKSNTFTAELILNSRLSSTNSKNINDPEYFNILPNVKNIFETHRYLYYAYKTGPFHHKIFYDKTQNKIFEIDPDYNLLKDDIAGGPDFIPISFSEGNMCSWTSMRRFRKYLKSETFSNVQVKNSTKKENLEKVVLSLKNSDDPIVTFVKIKN